MGLSNRLKERREQLGLTQGEVASLLGITPGAVGNYENGVSTPKADILFKVFDALKCDANYLFQDEMNNHTIEDSATPFEMDHLIKRYRDLDLHGKEMVDFTLQKEWERSTDITKSNISEYKNTTAQAAHNNHQGEDGEQEKIQEDLSSLKRPK